MAERGARGLPFSDVDALMRVLDEPARPQTIELEVAVGAALAEGRLADAIVRAAGRHPMARARQVPVGPFDSNDRWEISEGLTSDLLEVASPTATVDATRDEFFSRHIDVSAGPPFRCLLVHAGDGGDRLLLSVSHVAFDGVGALRLLRSISHAYADEHDPTPAVDPEEARRHVSAATRRTSPTSAGGSPARITGDPGATATTFGILHLDLDAQAVRRVGDASVNDVLLAAAHLAIERWGRSRDVACDRITLMMPVNERPAEWRDDVVANLVQASSIESTANDRAHVETLVTAIARQTTRIKLDGVRPSIGTIPQRTPIVLRRLLPRLVDAGANRTADTAVLSNLGLVDDESWFGARGKGLWFSPPPRRPVTLTIGAVTNGGVLGISLRWCNDSFSSTNAQVFASMLVDALASVQQQAT